MRRIYIILLFVSSLVYSQSYTIVNPYDGVDFGTHYKSMLHMHSQESDGNYLVDALIEDQDNDNPSDIFGTHGYYITSNTDHDNWPTVKPRATASWEHLNGTPDIYYTNLGDTSSVHYPGYLEGNEMLNIRGNELTGCGSTVFTHINAYFSDIGFPDCPTNGFAEYMDSIVVRDALGVFNHVGRHTMPATDYVAYFETYRSNMIGIEIYNYNDLYTETNPRVLWDSINALMAYDSLIWATSNDDFHSDEQYRNYNVHYSPDLTESEVRASLENGAFTASHEPAGNGTEASPVLTNVVITGNTITITSTGSDSIRWFDYKHDSILTANAIDVSNYPLTNFVRAEIYNSSGITYTQPFGISLDASEMISNGGFTSATDWTVGASWSISDDSARYDSVAIGTLSQIDADMLISIEANSTYTAYIDVTATSVLGAAASFAIYSTSLELYVADTDYNNTSHTFEFTTPADIGDGGILLYAFTDRPFIIDSISLKKNATVGDSPYYVDPDGSDLASGSISEPWQTFRKAFLIADAGDTVYFRDGVYYEERTVTLNNSGAVDDSIYFWAYPGEDPIMDCKNFGENMPPNTSGDVYGYAIYMERKEYINFKGLTIRNALQHDSAANNYWLPNIGTIHGYLTANLSFEDIYLHNLGKKGFYIVSGAYNSWDWDTTAATGTPWVDGFDYDTTKFLNCDVIDVCDSLSWVLEEGEKVETGGNHGDGWKVENWQGTMYIHTNCRALKYSDDGFDPNHAGYKIYKNCTAMATNKYANFPSAELNGFKQSAIFADMAYPDSLLDPTDTIYVRWEGCTALFCTIGFYDNLFLGVDDVSFVPDNSVLYNCAAYGNREGMFGFTRPSDTITETQFRNNIFFGSTGTDCGKPADFFIAGGVDFHRESNNNFDYVYDAGSCPRWVYTDTINTDADNFTSGLDSTILNDRAIAPRNPDGSLPYPPPLELAEGSNLIDAGIEIPESDNSRVTRSFYGLSPDVGPSESNYGAATTVRPYSQGSRLFMIGDRIFK